MTGLWERIFGKKPVDVERTATLAESSSALRVAKRVALENIVSERERRQAVERAVRKEEAALLALAENTLAAFQKEELR